MIKIYCKIYTAFGGAADATKRTRVSTIDASASAAGITLGTVHLMVYLI